MSTIRNIVSICLFLCLFSYTLCLFIKNIRPFPAFNHKGKFLVNVSINSGIIKMPLDDYLTGVLSSSVFPVFDDETIKAQCVILRSIIYTKSLANGSIVRNEENDFLYEDKISRQKKYGKTFDEMEERLKNAILSTKDVVIQYNGEIITPPYFYLSAGMTRDGKELLGEGYGYLKSVVCDRDFTEKSYIQEFYFTWENIKNFTKIEISHNMPLIIRDKSGYAVKISFGSKDFSGEEFRKHFNLPSAAFDIEIKEKGIKVITRGVGIGLGFAQYAADIQAKGGMDYVDLLEYFFNDVTVSKSLRR